MNWILAAIGFVLSVVGIEIVKSAGFRAVSHDNRWSDKPVYGMGGIAFCFPVLAFLLIIGEWFLESMAFCIFVLGLIDDVRESGVSAKVKFLIQVAVSASMAWFFFGFGLWSLAAFAWILAMINAFNFIDNMDGICVGVSFPISLFIWLNLDCAMGILLAWGLLGFLVYNAPKASVYMGDCGSTTLGFLLSVLALKSGGGNVGLWLPVLFAIPIVDLTYIVIRRLLEGKAPWIGDTNHLSHILGRRIGDKGTFWAFFIVQLGLFCMAGLWL